jgi:hypothetical protein
MKQIKLISNKTQIIKNLWTLKEIITLKNKINFKIIAIPQKIYLVAEIAIGCNPIYEKFSQIIF